jgi:ATP-dependent Lon protease
MKQSEANLKEYSILTVKDLIIFPNMILPWQVESSGLIKLIDDALSKTQPIAVFTLHDDNHPFKHGQICSLATILRLSKSEEGVVRIILQGLSRIKFKEITDTIPYFKGSFEETTEIKPDDLETRALTEKTKETFLKILEHSPGIPHELINLTQSLNEPGIIADLAISQINISVLQKQEVLDSLDVKDRLKIVLGHLTQKLEILDLGLKIQSSVKNKIDKTQKEYYLREQMKAIQKELGESEHPKDEIEKLKHKLLAKNLPEDALKESNRELERLSKIHPSSAEYSVSLTYLNWILELPWNEETEDVIDIEIARKELDQNHYDLERVKKRIIEYLALLKHKPDAKGTILCFVGPPGTGKTSLGKSIANSLGRKFHRIALGGVRDEAEIRGHRRTYVGALPGRIIQALRKVGVKNPVIMFDEIDKIGSDFRGDASSAMLEALDPEQNSRFTDLYLGMEFDLSKIIFLTTANTLDTISQPLLDRMEILELSGYTPNEKIEIAKKYLVPRQLSAHNLTDENIKFDKTSLARIISDYTREAGVRNLEREISSICRAVTRDIVTGKQETIKITKTNVPKFLGSPKFEHEVAHRALIQGVATGLAWTPFGGEILFIESAKARGNGKLILTGKLGEVMKESAQTSLSLVMSCSKDLELSEDIFKEIDIHLHIPAGAIPKDGPSAGVAITMSLASLLTNKSIKSLVAMTGEISLRGLVLPVGGIKEKILAAHRSGIKEIILPKRNQNNLEDIPKEIQNEIIFHPVSNIKEVFEIALFEKKKRKK